MDTKAEHVLSVIRNRQSLRIFDTKATCEEEENALIEAAMRAPTAGNQMLYSMIIIRDQAKKSVCRSYVIINHLWQRRL